MPDYWRIDGELMDRLCRIAKLDLGEKDKERYMKQLSAVLDTFKTIGAVETTGEPAFHPVRIENAWREDSVEENAWEPIKNAKESERGFFKGPRIV